MKKIIALLMAFTLMFTMAVVCAGCNGGAKTDSEYVQNKKVLRVGVTVYEPMDYQDDDENWIGFDADLATEFAKELGVEVKFVVIQWKQKVMELNSKEIDCIWNGMTISEELENNLDFSISYATNMQCAVIKKSNATAITTVDQVKASTIACEAGSAGYTVCREELGLSESDTKLNAVSAQVNALAEVAAGTSQVAILDYTMAYNVVGKGQYSDLMIVDTEAVSFGKEEFGIGFRTGSDLVEKANAFLKKAYADGTMTKLLELYNVALNDAKLKA